MAPDACYWATFEDMFTPATRARAIKENTRTLFHQVTERLVIYSRLPLAAVELGLWKNWRDLERLLTSIRWLRLASPGYWQGDLVGVFGGPPVSLGGLTRIRGRERRD